jgi:hypothetical protein
MDWMEAEPTVAEAAFDIQQQPIFNFTRFSCPQCGVQGIVFMFKADFGRLAVLFWPSAFNG